MSSDACGTLAAKISDARARMRAAVVSGDVPAVSAAARGRVEVWAHAVGRNEHVEPGALVVEEPRLRNEHGRMSTPKTITMTTQFSTTIRKLCNVQ